jgi:ankyrin repeat protein
MPSPDAPGAALSEAADRGDLAAVADLLAQGADISAPGPRTPLYDGETVLISAANRGQVDLLRWLLARGADVNARSTSGWTALMRACSAGRTRAARILLDAGAGPGIANDEGCTACGRVPGSNAELLQLMHGLQHSSGQRGEHR